MAAIKMYMYKGCGTCKKASRWLNEQGIAFNEIPIREQPPTVAELKRMLKAQEGALRKLFNTSGGDYKAMNMKEVLGTMSDDEALLLLAKHGNLVKRPFVVSKDVMLVGFKEAVWAEAFGK